jgi:hypothetical protein
MLTKHLAIATVLLLRWLLAIAKAVVLIKKPFALKLLTAIKLRIFPFALSLSKGVNVVRQGSPEVSKDSPRTALFYCA